MNIGIYIYDNAEVLDFSGPFEVFSTAARLATNHPTFNVFLVAENEHAVNARGGFSVNPDFHLYNHPPIDVLIVVGGVHNKELNKPKVLEWVKETASISHTVASVCTGAFILAEANVLTDQNVTTHWEDIPSLRKSYPNLKVAKNKRWVDEGKIITSGGISAGIDMSLHLVSKLLGKKLAVKTAQQMEFDWTYE